MRQLDAVARRLLTRLASAAPLLPGGGVLAFIDMDSMQKRVYGHAKDGAGFGHTKIQGKSLTVRGLNALAAVVFTPLAAPVIAAARLRGGTANSARGAASLAAEAISTARQAGCTGQIVFRTSRRTGQRQESHARKTIMRSFTRPAGPARQASEFRRWIEA